MSEVPLGAEPRQNVAANQASGCALSLPIIQSQGTGSVTTERIEGEASTHQSHQLLNLYPHTHIVLFLRVTSEAEGVGSKREREREAPVQHNTSNLKPEL